MLCNRLTSWAASGPTVALALACALPAVAEGQALATAPLDASRWRLEGEEMGPVEHLGRQCLKLDRARATLRDVVFSDGIVEFDMAFGPERAFGGLVFRYQDDANYEYFYVRPHQSGRPDSFQYMPVFNGVESWQLYHGEGYTGQVSFPFDEWLHVRVVLSGDRAEISLGSEGVVLAIRELKRGSGGGALQLRGGGLAPFYFSNFEYRPLQRPTLSGERASEAPVASGTVSEWSVSEPFEEASLDHQDASAVAAGRQRWSRLSSEDLGIANLARLSGRTDERNTAFARVQIHAERPLSRLIQFGYSDRVRVYLNGRLLYSGDNTYASRDFRYLGTIGLFDSVPLSLKQGENELLFAVTESFGGWGIQARFPDSSQIQWEP